MNPEQNKSPETQRREEMVVNEQALAAMMDVPFDNFKEVIQTGDPDNTKIQGLNKEAAAEFEHFLDELNQELKGTDVVEEAPAASPETLQRILNTVSRAMEKRKAQAAQELGPQASAAYWEDRQRQVEKKPKKSWKRL
jgi:hypothetical protein